MKTVGTAPGARKQVRLGGEVQHQHVLVRRRDGDQRAAFVLADGLGAVPVDRVAVGPVTVKQEVLGQGHGGAAGVTLAAGMRAARSALSTAPASRPCRRPRAAAQPAAGAGRATAPAMPPVPAAPAIPPAPAAPPDPAEPPPRPPAAGRTAGAHPAAGRSAAGARRAAAAAPPGPAGRDAAAGPDDTAGAGTAGAGTAAPDAPAAPRPACPDEPPLPFAPPLPAAPPSGGRLKVQRRRPSRRCQTASPPQSSPPAQAPGGPLRPERTSACRISRDGPGAGYGPRSSSCWSWPAWALPPTCSARCGKSRPRASSWKPTWRRSGPGSSNSRTRCATWAAGCRRPCFKRST